MKTTYRIERDELRPPARSRELALFTCTLQSAALREWLASSAIDLPEHFEITHNTGSDDPPDISALGLGWECTEFPPNQSAIDKVHAESGPEGMIVPGYSQTGGDIQKIREQSVPFTSYPRFVAVDEEIAAFSDAFLTKVVGGPKSKDVHGNDVLLLDRRGNHAPDLVETGLRHALQKKRPQHIRLILLVGWKRYEVGDTTPVPEVVRAFP